MFKLNYMSLVAFFILIAPVGSLAEQRGLQAQAKDAGHEMHEAVDNLAGMVSLGECVRQGIRANALIKAYDQEAIAAMKVMGVESTHHLMVFFSNAETGMKITDGLAAVKVKDVAENESKPLKLAPMAEGFGADIRLAFKGDYEIVFGTRLMDGKKRQFEFFYLNLQGAQVPAASPVTAADHQD